MAISTEGFKAITKADEMTLLAPERRGELIEYLSGLAEMVLEKKRIPNQTKLMLMRRFVADIPEVGRVYQLRHRRYKLSTFFAWHIRQRIREANK